jgi:hypothetical protein
MREHPLRTIRHFGQRNNGKHWCWDGTGKQPRIPATFDPQKPDRTHLSKWSPCNRKPDDRVAGSQGYTLPKANVTSDSKRFPIEVLNEATGKLEKRFCRITTNELTLTVYGRTFSFKKTNRGLTILDGRDNSRRSPDWIRGELCRMLDENAGIAAYDALMAV